MFLDRVDLYFDTPPVTAVDLALPPPTEGAAEARARVAAARDIQAERFGVTGDDTCRLVNADAPLAELEKVARPDQLGATLLADAASRLNLTARGYSRVLKVARTIAELDGSDAVRRVHIAGALSYRQRPAGQGEGVNTEEWPLSKRLLKHAADLNKS